MSFVQDHTALKLFECGFEQPEFETGQVWYRKRHAKDSSENLNVVPCVMWVKDENYFFHAIDYTHLQFLENDMYFAPDEQFLFKILNTDKISVGGVTFSTKTNTWILTYVNNGIPGIVRNESLCEGLAQIWLHINNFI